MVLAKLARRIRGIVMAPANELLCTLLIAMAPAN
jgi:hypothetical protein